MAADLPFETWAHPRSRRTLLAWGTSFALHAALTASVAWWLHLRALTPHEADASAPTASTVTIDLPSMTDLGADPSDGTVAAPDVRDPIGELPPTFGGALVPRPDTGDPGRGGQMQVAAPALNLADRDEHVHFSPDPLDRLDRDQIQRLKTAKERTAWEDRRATLHPTELSFLASGQGDRPERRDPSKADPSRGMLAALDASHAGGTLGGTGTDDPSADPDTRSRGALDRGDLTSAAGLGVTNGQMGIDHRDAANVAHARPDVAVGPTTIPARTVARPNDTLDSDQEVATALQSLVHASTSGGIPGQGEGGSQNGGAPATGGTIGTGSHATPLGTGPGDWFDIDGSDPRLLPYFRTLHAKIEPKTRNAFPKEALLDLRQGTVILDFIIHADGSVDVEWPPHRPSGIPAFDKACAEAIRTSAPFAPPPLTLLGPNAHDLKIRAPFAETHKW